MEIVEKLTNTKQRTLEYFNLPPEALDRNRGDNSWSIRIILQHLADTETVLYERIRRTIAEPNRQVIFAFDQDAWVTGLNYDRQPIAIAQNIFASVRDAIIFLAKEHYEANGGRQYVHSEVGLRTLKDEFDKVAWHNQRHLDQIAEALARQS